MQLETSTRHYIFFKYPFNRDIYTNMLINTHVLAFFLLYSLIGAKRSLATGKIEQSFLQIILNSNPTRLNANDDDDYTKRCDRVDSSSIGLIYFFLPDRLHLLNTHKPRMYPHYTGAGGSSRENVFKLNNFYSLLTLAKLFNASPSDRILFYYIDQDHARPASTHYNQWLNDSFWTAKIALEAVKFVPYRIRSNNQSNNSKNNISAIDYDLFEISNRIRKHAMSEFDRMSEKKRFLFVTSDVILGPRILTCFSKDSTVDREVSKDKNFICV